MTNLTKLKYAKLYIKKLANGMNPLTNQPVNTDDIVRNEHIRNCFNYVADILQKVIENDGMIKSNKKENFYITDNQKTLLSAKNTSCQIGAITTKINSVTKINDTDKFVGSWITDWLLDLGMLELQGKKRVATPRGTAQGIITQKKQYERIENLYSPEMQNFIFDNINAIIAYHYKVEKHGTIYGANPE